MQHTNVQKEILFTDANFGASRLLMGSKYMGKWMQLKLNYLVKLRPLLVLVDLEK